MKKHMSAMTLKTRVRRYSGAPGIWITMKHPLQITFNKNLLILAGSYSEI